MAMVKLTDQHYVAADQVAEVTVTDYADRITVTLKSGDRYSVLPGYGQGVYATMAALIEQINAAQGGA